MNETQLLLNALAFSAYRHRHQKRKGADQTPYINHPIQVANLLSNVGEETNINLLLAAILHDTVEDTAETQEEKDVLKNEITEKFGLATLEIVMEVTDNKFLPKSERKMLQILHAPHKSVNAKKLKIADKISNILEITNNPPENWPNQRKIEYLEWATKVVAGLRGVNSKLEKLFDESLLKAYEKIDKL